MCSQKRKGKDGSRLDVPLRGSRVVRPARPTIYMRTPHQRRSGRARPKGNPDTTHRKRRAGGSARVSICKANCAHQCGKNVHKETGHNSKCKASRAPRCGKSIHKETGLNSASVTVCVKRAVHLNVGKTSTRRLGSTLHVKQVVHLDVGKAST